MGLIDLGARRSMWRRPYPTSPTVWRRAGRKLWDALAVLRPQRVVAWGGRPGYDIWVGSKRDARRQRALDRQWALKRELIRVTLRAFTGRYKLAILGMGVKMERFAADMARAQNAIRRASYWGCRRCGAINKPPFTVCSRCNTPRSTSVA